MVQAPTAAEPATPAPAHPGRSRLLAPGRPEQFRRRRELFRRRRLVLIAAVVVVAAILAVAVRSVLSSTPSVVVTTAAPAAIDAEIGGVGTTSTPPSSTVAIDLNLSGITTPIRITELDVTEGSVVKQGDTLLKLDPSVVEANKAQISLQLAGAQASLQAAQSAESTATSSSEKSSFAVEVQTEQSQVSLDQELLSVANGNTNSITAPVSGSVTGITVAAGQAVANSQILMKIVNTTEIQVDTGVNLSDLPAVQVGDRASITFSALPGIQLAGQVATISPRATANGLQGTVVVQAPNSTSNPVPIGTQAFVQIKAPEQATVSVPEIAVVNQDLDPSVYVVRNGRVYRQGVVVGAVDSQSAQILSGLSSGQVVAMTGTQTLTNGQKVRVKK